MFAVGHWAYTRYKAHRAEKNDAKEKASARHDELLSKVQTNINDQAGERSSWSSAPTSAARSEASSRLPPSSQTTTPITQSSMSPTDYSFPQAISPRTQDGPGMTEIPVRGKWLWVPDNETGQARQWSDKAGSRHQTIDASHPAHAAELPNTAVTELPAHPVAKPLPQTTIAELPAISTMRRVSDEKIRSSAEHGPRFEEETLRPRAQQDEGL